MGQAVNIAENVGEMVEIIHRIALSLDITLVGPWGAWRLNITFGISLPVEQIELQLYRYHREQSPLAQCLPQMIQHIAGFNVKGSAIFVKHGQQQLADVIGVRSRRRKRAGDG